MKAAAKGLTGRRKAAILMVLLGDDLAADIYKNLPKSEVRLITQEIAELSDVPPATAAEVLQEYFEQSRSQEYSVQGGEAYANKLLVKAFGVESARALLAETPSAADLSAQHLNALRDADPKQLVKVLQSEHPQTIALVLAHLSAKNAQQIFMLLPEAMRGPAITRLAQMQEFSPDTIKKVAEVLHSRLSSATQQKRQDYSGIQAVADLLNQVDKTASHSILEAIEQSNAELASSIRNQMFVFEDFLEIPESGLRELLGQIDKKQLGIALKGSSEDLRNHFFKCMSSRAVEMLKEDMEALGPMRTRDVQAGQQEIVALARRLEGDGKMILKSDTEESYVL
jgi:flagellar motor switch protein FliG